MKHVAVLAAALFLVGACRKHETVSAGGSTVEVDRSGKVVTIRTAEGTATAGGSALPEGFPKDVPVYPGARVTASLVTPGTTGHVATFETSEWPDDVAKFYAGKLAGWTTAMDMKTEDGHTLLMKSPDGKRTLTLAATRQALNTIFTLTVSGS
jgi:hypothetical protein